MARKTSCIEIAHCSAHRLSLMGTRLTGIVLFSALADPRK